MSHGHISSFTSFQSLEFSRLKNALELDWKGDEAAKKLRRTPNTFFILQGKCIAPKYKTIIYA